MKKKVLAVIMAAAVTAACLGGCGKTEENSGVTGAEEENSSEAEFTFTAATNAAEDSINHILVARFKENVEEKSNGKCTVTLYENGQLGGDRELTEGVISGSVDFIVGMTGSLVDFIPETALFDAPNVFPDIETSRKVLDGQILEDLQTAYDKAGIKLFAYADSGFRVMTSNKAVRKLSDFKGIKIRTMENKNHISYWTKLGANPTPMDFSELYMSLEQGTLDAQENPYDLIVANKLYEPQKYVIETNHLLHTLNMVGSKATFDALPEEIQKTVTESAVEAHQYAREQADIRIDEKKKTITDFGDEIIILDDSVKKEMEDEVSSIYDEIRQQAGAELVDRLLEEVKNAK